MSFGLRDNDWVDPDEPSNRKYYATCHFCTNCVMCPCGDHAWCREIHEVIDPHEVFEVSDCDSFEAIDPEEIERMNEQE